MNIRYWLWWILLMGVGGDAIGQSSAGRIYPVFPEGQGWNGSPSFNNDLLLDFDGFLWLATNSSLVKWNGQTKRFYNDSSETGFYVPGTMFEKLFQTQDSNLVILHQDQRKTLSLLRRGKKKSETIPFIHPANLSKSAYLIDVFQRTDGPIYATINDNNALAIYKLVKDKMLWQRTIPFEKSIDKKNIHTSFYGDEFWVGIEALGIWRCGPVNCQEVFDLTAIPDHPAKILSFLKADQKNRLWLGLNDENNLYQWDDSRKQFVAVPYPGKHPVHRLQEDTQGNLLFINGTYPYSIKELRLLSDTTWLDYSKYLRPEVTDVYPSEDFTNSFFAFTSANIELIEVSQRGVQQLLVDKIPAGKNYGQIIKGINEDLKGNLYFLSEIDEFFKLDHRTGLITEIPLLDDQGRPIKFQCGGALHRDPKGNLWFKNCDRQPMGRLVKFDPITQQIKIYYLNELIRDIDFGGPNELFVTHHNYRDKKGQLSVFDLEKETFKRIELKDETGETSFSEPRFCYYQNDTTVWVGTMRGLVWVNPKTKTFQVFTTENSQLQNDKVILIHQYSDTELLLGTYGGGVQIFNFKTGNNKSFIEKENVLQNYVCGILPIDSTRFWLSTFAGVIYWDTRLNLFSPFTHPDDFGKTEFNRYAFYQSKAGDNYFGNVNGVHRFRTEDLLANQASPRLGIDKITQYFGGKDTLVVRQSDLENTHKIILPPGVTYLQLDFYINDLKGRGFNTIFTKLEGYDDDWVPTNDRQQVRYRLLPPGSYILKVKGYSAAGVPTQNEIAVEIVSKDYYYRSGWFALLGFGVMMGLLTWFYQWRMKKFQLEQLNQQDIQKRFAALELQALQAQLNPHFIFNALGAIQYYIQVHDVEAADVYLTRFAQLMRKYLDGSKEKITSILKEIELLKIYTELEELRFDHVFTTQITVEENLEIEETYLPSMMIQPFVENSVNHGLSPRKDGKGKLEIKFYKKGSKVFCEIRDNGIGRENARKFRRKGHQSRGMTILEEKIKTMQQAGMMDIEVEITDQFPEKTDFPGTVVKLTINHLND